MIKFIAKRLPPSNRSLFGVREGNQGQYIPLISAISVATISTYDYSILGRSLFITNSFFKVGAYFALRYPKLTQFSLTSWNRYREK